jgi:hypothetical protein
MEPLNLVIPTFDEADTIVAVSLKIPRRPIVRTSLSMLLSGQDPVGSDRGCVKTSDRNGNDQLR